MQFFKEVLTERKYSHLFNAGGFDDLFSELLLCCLVEHQGPGYLPIINSS